MFCRPIQREDTKSPAEGKPSRIQQQHRSNREMGIGELDGGTPRLTRGR